MELAKTLIFQCVKNSAMLVSIIQIIGIKTFRARVVYREAWSEGSETAKPGTDEQNVHKRYVEWGKQKISPESGNCNFPVLKE